MASAAEAQPHPIASDDETALAVEDSTMTDAQTRKKKHHILYQATLRKPAWTYFHLELFRLDSQEEPADIITLKRNLTSALQRFLGLHGAAIPVDILKVEADHVWVRVPREDATAVHEAIVSWTSDGVKWIVKGRDEWLVRLASDGLGQDLFKP